MLVNSSDNASVDVAAGGAEEVAEAGDAAAVPEAEEDGAEDVAAGNDQVAQDAATADDVADVDEVEAGPAEDVSSEVLGESTEPAVAELLPVEDASVDPLEGVRNSLSNDGIETVIETQSSAVELAPGSGVLVIANDDGSYAGLATRFGSETTTIGLESDNGLDWSEVGLTGVPAGATASQLVEYEGAFVALFESFDSASGRQTFVGTSTDLATWDVSAPLAGEPFATDLAVGNLGVIVLGDDSAPDVWVGPIGGPYERTARLAAVSVSGVTTLGDEFLVAGRSTEGATLFRSTDGVDWTGAALSSPNIPGATPTVSVDDGIIILSNVTTGGSTSLISSDGGTTWDQINTGSDSVAINSTTLGFLGFSDGGAAVAIANDESFALAEIDVVAPDRLSLVAAGNDEVVLLQATEGGANWIIASR